MDDNIGDDTTAVNPAADVEMSESAAAEDGAGESSELPFAGEDTVVESQSDPARVPFIEYLTSPMVTLIVGNGEKETILTAHQALLAQSPYFENLCNNFTDDGSVSSILDLLLGSPSASCARCATCCDTWLTHMPPLSRARSS